MFCCFPDSRRSFGIVGDRFGLIVWSWWRLFCVFMLHWGFIIDNVARLIWGIGHSTAFRNLVVAFKNSRSDDWAGSTMCWFHVDWQNCWLSFFVWLEENFFTYFKIVGEAQRNWWIRFFPHVFSTCSFVSTAFSASQFALELQISDCVWRIPWDLHHVMNSSLTKSGRLSETRINGTPNLAKNADIYLLTVKVVLSLIRNASIRLLPASTITNIFPCSFMWANSIWIHSHTSAFGHLETVFPAMLCYFDVLWHTRPPDNHSQSRICCLSSYMRLVGILNNLTSESWQYEKYNAPLDDSFS